MTGYGGARPATLPYVVFSDDWGRHPSSSQHIVRHLAREHDVAWINTIGMRQPRFGLVDLRKILQKTSGMLRGAASAAAEVPNARFTVHQPLMLPYSSVAAARRFNSRSVRRTLEEVRQRLGRPVVLTTVPNSCDYVDAIGSERIVYYCVDDFSEWPGLDKSLVLEMEEKLIEKADVFVASSPELRERLAGYGKPAHLLTHGVDVEHFASDAPAVLPALADVPQPRIGYFGLFDDRSDKELVESLARRLPRVSVVVTGSVETNVDRLRQLRNVHFTGRVPYAELPSLIKGLDLLFIPYRVDGLSKSLSPLKLKEYLATGLPVVSTPIEAVKPFQDCIHTATTLDEWSGRIISLLDRKSPKRRAGMAERLAGESWQNKACLMNAICHGEPAADVPHTGGGMRRK